jgi:hypothetical protein
MLLLEKLAAQAAAAAGARVLAALEIHQQLPQVKEIAEAMAGVRQMAVREAVAVRVLSVGIVRVQHQLIRAVTEVADQPFLHL